MEVRIGIKEGRELGFETDQSPKELSALVKQGMNDGVLELNDNKGRSYLIPASAVAFIEIGAEESRRVGFLA